MARSSEDLAEEHSNFLIVQHLEAKGASDKLRSQVQYALAERGKTWQSQAKPSFESTTGAQSVTDVESDVRAAVREVSTLERLVLSGMHGDTPKDDSEDGSVQNLFFRDPDDADGDFASPWNRIRSQAHKLCGVYHGNEPREDSLSDEESSPFKGLSPLRLQHQNSASSSGQELTSDKSWLASRPPGYETLSLGLKELLQEHGKKTRKKGSSGMSPAMPSSHPHLARKASELKLTRWSRYFASMFSCFGLLGVDVQQQDTPRSPSNSVSVWDGLYERSPRGRVNTPSTVNCRSACFDFMSAVAQMLPASWQVSSLPDRVSQEGGSRSTAALVRIVSPPSNNEAAFGTSSLPLSPYPPVQSAPLLSVAGIEKTRPLGSIRSASSPDMVHQ
eukprot:TRINITY_DN82243_c0_g1_i1.p1 TRINITY_DN82243_c0_g1~~TRINITY_DN82243_c0_g1_i1.p1  ORF type:complete len:389 (+),score=54.33 TRINITY_DN82243_c0_g1_i1:113-1279(+)